MSLYDKYPPRQIGPDLAYWAMIHFLVGRFNESEAPESVGEFILNLTVGDVGRPASDEMLTAFKEALVEADHMELVPRLRTVG